MTSKRIDRVDAMGGTHVRVHWEGGGIDTIDLIGVMSRLKVFAPLSDQGVFEGVRVVHYGRGIGWTEDAELSADTLARLAEEQRPFGPRDFVMWQRLMNLSNQEAADTLDVSLATIKNYRAGKTNPPANVAIACRALARDPVVFRAHFRPRRAGRPRAKASA